MANAKRSRNYVGEAEWLKKNYKRFEAKLELELGEEFAEFLKENRIRFTDWVRDNYEKDKRRMK